MDMQHNSSFLTSC